VCSQGDVLVNVVMSADTSLSADIKDFLVGFFETVAFIEEICAAKCLKSCTVSVSACLGVFPDFSSDCNLLETASFRPVAAITPAA
jgi:hypothetical protein